MPEEEKNSKKTSKTVAKKTQTVKKVSTPATAEKPTATSTKAPQQRPNDYMFGTIAIRLNAMIERNLRSTHSATARYTPSLGIASSRKQIHAAIDQLLNDLEDPKE